MVSHVKKIGNRIYATLCCFYKQARPMMIKSIPPTDILTNGQMETKSRVHIDSYKNNKLMLILFA
jgi:hypothetical protein